MKVWVNGEAVAGPIAIDASDRGLTLGDGVFETVLVRNGKPVWLEEHLARMRHGAAALGIMLPAQSLQGPSSRTSASGARARSGTHREARTGGEAGTRIAEVGAVEEWVPDRALAMLGLVRDDGMAGSLEGDGVYRVTLTRGVAARGLAAAGDRPALIETLNSLPADFAFAPVSLATAATRRNEHSPASRLKTLSYIDNILAAREAAIAGAEEALMLNTAGRAACCSVGNIFAVMRDGILTPPVSEGVLAGIVREQLVGSGLAREQPLTVEDLERAEALFVTNSLRLLRPVTSLDGRPYEVTHPRLLLAIALLKKRLDD